MIITCGQCLAKFKVAPEQIKETGSKVRCSNCQHVFTVYRPGFEPDDREIDRQPLYYSPEESRSPAASEKTDSATDHYDQDDDFYHDHDSYDDDQDGQGGDELQDSEEDFYSAGYSVHERYSASKEDTESLSLKERRDRRRQLYSDLEDTEDEPGSEEEEFYYEEDDLVGQDGRPPLRRAASRALPPEEEFDQAEEYDQEADEEYEESDYGEEDIYEEGEEYEEYEEEYDDAYEGEDEYDLPAGKNRRPSLGLAADPVEQAGAYIDDADYRGRGQGSEGAAIRAAVSKVSKRPSLPVFIVVALLVIALAAGIFFFVRRPAPTALSSGDQAAGETGSSSQGLIETDTADSAGTKRITFARTNQNHYFRQNREGGQLLIITGMVRNSYEEPRSFIRLRGHLLGNDGISLAERFVYAGNIISDEDLQSLPPAEILNRLSIKGGQDGKNMNVQPGAEIPFMVVFDKLPNDITEYRVDPVGSSPAQGQ